MLLFMDQKHGPQEKIKGHKCIWNVKPAKNVKNKMDR